MVKASRASGSNRLRFLAISFVMIGLPGCGEKSRSFLSISAPALEETSLARHIEVEVENLASGLPCKVIDRPNAETRKVLWRADYEKGFCDHKAEETRLVLKSRGWACRPQGDDERQDLVRSPNTNVAGPPYLVAAWLCLEGLDVFEVLEPSSDDIVFPPPRPRPRPTSPAGEVSFWDNEALRSAVERDLSTIGQDVLDDETLVDAAQGDLNGDGTDDAVVMLTRQIDQATPHRLLMAYLRNGETYGLVDIWVLKSTGGQAADDLDLAIDNGRVRLGDCCQDEAEPTVLVLDDRTLVEVDDRS